MKEIGRRLLPYVALLAFTILLIGILPVGDALWAKVLRVAGTVNTGTFEQGCTYTQGYWKNHPDAWPPLDGITIGGVDYYSKEEAIGILETPPKGDATYIVAHQLIAAKLNILKGANGSDVESTIGDADDWLMSHAIGTDPSDPDRAQGIGYAETLTDYNEGRKGPGHCDDAEDPLPEPELLGLQTPTATATPTGTPTATPEATATEAATATRTPTATATPEEIAPAVPTATATPTPTNTAKATPTPTDTATATPTATDVPTATPTDTEVPTATPTDTDVPPADTEVPTPT